MTEKKSTPAEDKPAELNEAQQRDQRFYFPEQNITITAATREEAEKELADIIKQEKEEEDK